MKRLVMVVTALLGLSLLSGCGYNVMQANEEAVFSAWGDVEAAYQRRADLIPNLVEVVKGYAKHEAETLTAVTEARAKVGSMQVTRDTVNNPETLAKFQQAQGELSSALSRLMVVVERYPDLKANQNFLDLQKSLTEIEDQVQMARRYYNGTVRENNVLVESFPSNLIARLSGFTKGDFFELEDEAERKAPQVRFN